MHSICKLLSAALLLCSVSCSGFLPGVGILAPASPAKYTMSYTDLEASHLLSFSPDGTYREKRTDYDGGKRETKGTWDWDRHGDSKAVLTLDGIKKFNLDFTTRSHAGLRIEGDKRPYSADFDQPED